MTNIEQTTYDYEFINHYNGTRTPTGKMEYDFTTAYFMRSLYQRVLSTIDFMMPDTWNRNYFKNVLFSNGFIGVVKTDYYGIIPQICTLTGYGLYLQPTELLVSQPLVNFHGTIGKTCELIKLTPDYKGILDIVEHYAVQLSTLWTSAKTSAVNSRLAWVAIAKNKQSAATLKMIAEQLSAGESTIIVDKFLKDDVLEAKDPLFTEAFRAKENYITDRIILDIRSTIADFDREIGIPVVDEKKERRIESEISSLVSDAGTRLDTWCNCLDETIERTNRLFDLNLSYKRRGVKDVVEPTTDIIRNV